MSCTNKWCSWIQAVSQILIAVVVVFAGITVNSHMESWTTSFSKGSNDIHSIRNNMNNIAYSMESINNDMDNINTHMRQMTEVGIDIKQQTGTLVNNLTTINKQLDYMNYSVRGMRENFSPHGMVKTMMPF